MYDLTRIVNNNVHIDILNEINEDKELFEVLLYKGLNYINKVSLYMMN